MVIVLISVVLRRHLPPIAAELNRANPASLIIVFKLQAIEGELKVITRRIFRQFNGAFPVQVFYYKGGVQNGDDALCMHFDQ
jgi:hypothetical protein